MAAVFCFVGFVVVGSLRKPHEQLRAAADIVSAQTTEDTPTNARPNPAGSGQKWEGTSNEEDKVTKDKQGIPTKQQKEEPKPKVAVGPGTPVVEPPMSFSRLVGHKGKVTGLKFSPDGSTLATEGEDLTVRLWDTTTYKQRTVLSGHEGYVVGFAFSDDGRKVITADRRTAMVWDAVSGKREERYVCGLKDIGYGDAIGISDVIYRQRDLTVITADAFGINAWDSDSFNKTGKAARKIAQKGIVAFSSTGKFAGTWRRDGSNVVIEIHDLTTEKLLLQDKTPTFQVEGFGPMPNLVFGMAFSQDETMFAYGCADSSGLSLPGRPDTIIVWDLKKMEKRTLTLSEGSTIGSGLSFSPNGTLLATNTMSGNSKKREFQVQVWDLAGGNLKRTVKGSVAMASSQESACFSPDGHTLFVRDEKETRCVNIETGKAVTDYSDMVASCPVLTFSTDGTLMAAADDSGVVRVRRLQTQGKKTAAKPNTEAEKTPKPNPAAIGASPPSL